MNPDKKKSQILDKSLIQQMQNWNAYNHPDMELIYKQLSHFINSNVSFVKNDFMNCFLYKGT